MTEDVKHEIVKAKGSWLYFLSKVLFCIIAFLLVIFTVLGNMGGNSDFHRETIEQFASETTGFRAKITNLINLTYFPTISMDFEDMDLFNDPVIDTTVVHIDKAQVALSFWDVASRSGKIKVLNVRGIHVSPGVFLDKKITMEHFAINDTDKTHGGLDGQAYVGNTALVFSMEMAASGDGAGRKYWFPPRRGLRVDLGDIKISAVLQNAINPYLSFQDLKISREGKGILTGRLDISKRRAREVTITGELKSQQNGTLFKPDLIFDRSTGKLTGTIASENFNPADFAAGSAMDALIKRFVQYLGDPEKDAKIIDDFFAGHDITLDLKGDAVYHGKLQFRNNTLLLK
jgi:hypothetical protein